jgi:hypothetical protein
MVALNTIRRIEVVGTSSGLDETRAKLDALSRAQTTVATTAEGMATTTEKSSRRQLSAAGAYDRLKVTIDDSFRSSQKLASGQATIDRAFQQGAISVQEQAQAMQQLQAKFGTVAVANDNLGKAVSGSMGLARHELINLSRQAQDVAVSLAGGQSPLTVLFQQGSQIGDVFATSQGTVSGFFKQVTSSVGSFLTIGRVAFGGVAASIVGATMALNDYLDGQQKVQMSLLGSGRASGQSVSSINAVAQSSSSLTGFSTAEARAFAAELASTGKIGKANLEPIVKIGHDIAAVYGINAVEAARMLGKAFADPAQGAEQLNDRLGFLDAAMQRQIQNLQAQGRLWEAQRVLQAAVSSSLEGVSDAVSTPTKFWTALGNTASSAWDKIGAGLSRITGIGLKLGLDEQIATAQQRLESFQKDLETAQQYAKSLGPGAKGVDTGYDAAIAGVQKYQAEIDKLSATMERNATATTDAQQRQQSFAQSAAVRNQQPEIDQLQSLRNQQELLVKTLIDVQVSGGPASDMLRRMGVSYDELATAVGNATSKVNNFKTDFQQSVAAQAIQLKSLTAFSPSAKGDVAYEGRLSAELARQTLLVQATVLAEGDRGLAIKGATIALSEQSRARELSANQAVASAQLDIDMVGKSVGQQALLRANLQARQGLEQQILQQHAKWGPAQDAELAKLEEINKKYAERVQLAAKAQINDQIKEDRQTIGFTQEDQQIAQALKQAYPDITERMNSAEAAQMRLNNQMREMKDISAGFANDLVGGLMRGEDAMKALGTAATNLVQKLASKNLSNFMNGGDLFGSQNLNSAQGGLAVASAGVSAYQSGNAMSGALSGAMAGATFGPAGAVVGGAAGLIGGILGADAAAKKKLEEAKEEWRKAGPAFTKFLTEMSGGAQGDLAATFIANASAAEDLAIKADKAGDRASVTRVYEAAQRNAIDQSKKFLTTFDASLQGMTDGLGANSPFLSAANNVKSQLTAMQKFVDDARVSVGTIVGGVNGATGETLSNARPDQLAAIAEYTGRATAAAEAYLLTMLQQAPVLSTVQTALLNVNGTATALQASLVQLGMSSGDAAVAIQEGVVKALYAIKSQFEDSLTERMNTASGKGYLNDAAALVKQHMQDVADASSLGVDPAKVAALFRAEAQKIVNDAGLVGDSFNQFIGLFPDFSNAVTAATDALTASIKTINDYLDSLKIGNQSTLSPQEKLNEAQSQFNAQLTLAQKGNADAMGTITEYASTLLDQAKAFYASSAEYGDVYGAVTDALKGLTGSASMATGGMVPGYAAGGVVGNGIFGVDSVIARYAGGGSIGLAGGEFVMPAAQTQANLPVLQAMRSGAASNDNGRYFENLGQQLVRAMAGCSMGEIAAIREENAALRADIRRLIAAVEANKPKALRPADRGRAA